MTAILDHHALADEGVEARRNPSRCSEFTIELTQDELAQLGLCGRRCDFGIRYKDVPITRHSRPWIGRDEVELNPIILNRIGRKVKRHGQITVLGEKMTPHEGIESTGVVIRVTVVGSGKAVSIAAIPTDFERTTLPSVRIRIVPVTLSIAKAR